MNRQIGLKAKCTVLFSIFETDPIRMRQLLDNLFKNQSLIYKYFLYVVSVICIVFFFPRGGKFKYEFQKGKPWQYENLYAPFDFSIKKNSEEITREQNEVKKRQDRYFRYNNSVKDEVYNSYNDVFDNVFKPETYDENTLNLFRSAGTVILDRLYDTGILMKSDVPNSGGQDYLIVENEARPIGKKGLLRMPNVDDVIFDVLEDQQMSDFKDQFQELFLKS